MPFLRQSTEQVILFGPCLDKTDGVTEETGLTLAQADMRLSKDGGAFAQKSAAGNATHDSDGWYNTTLSTTDTDTIGELRLNVHQPANMLPVWDRWYVVEEEVYDDLFATNGVGYLKPTTAGRDLDVSTGGEAGVDWANVGSPTTTLNLSGTTVKTATDVETDTAEIGTAGAGLSDLGGMSTGMKAEVNVEALDVLNTDTITLPGQEAPPLAPTHRQAIGWLYKVFRNRKTQTSTTWSVMADDESTVDAKATVSDDGTTAIKQEVVTGP